MRIALSETKRVNELEAETQLLLSVIGHPEALVTDESRLSDFAMDRQSQDFLIDKIKRELGVECKRHTRIYKIAERI